MINTVAACISALAACGSAYFAARVIRDNREARKMELEAARPYFTFSNFGLRRPKVAKALSARQELLDPRAARIEGLIANDGRRTASDVSGALVILPINPDVKLGTFPLGIADDVAPKSEWHVSSAPLRVVPEDFPGDKHPSDYQDPGFFVMIYVRYKDPLTTKAYKQRSFMRWPGISEGVVAGNLISASHEEKTVLLQRYGEFLRPYMARRNE